MDKIRKNENREKLRNNWLINSKIIKDAIKKVCPLILTVII